ncbi:MAG: RHS repeat protein, partial [Betaproteobacteria bacterium]|nr:RHS repeat protein [Betaproteobacteria bacterium]
MNMQVLDTRRDASGGYKVDVSRGSHNGRVASEWFSRPDDQRYLSLDDLARSVRGRSERSRTRIIESALIHVEANHRSRAGETFTFAYDNLGRVTSKEVPTRSGLSTTHTRDVYYGYDLFGALTYARFDSTAGEGLNLTYNALGQLTSSTQSLDGITRTLGYQYDAAGRRTRITFPDAAYWQYQYDKLGRFTNLKDQLNRDLVLDAYYNFGIRYSHKREGSAPDDTYYLDFAKRLTRTFTDHPTAGYDVNQEWAYNPANQAVTESLDNQLFVWTGHPLNTSEVAYTSNGLNQIASGNSNAFTYDANGNLTFDGLTSFTYDTENRLVTASGQNNVALRYDPFGRLYEIDDGQGGVRRLLYDGDALVAEYNTAGTMLDRYIHGVGAGDDPLLRYPGSSTSYLDAEYMVTDRLGSVIARYKRDGTAVAIN